MATPMKGRLASTPGRAPRTPASSRREKRHATTPSHARPRDDTQGEEGIQVAIRMRPLNKNEGSHSRVWKVLPKYMSVAQTTAQGKPMPERVAGRNFFTFDKTFGEDCSTQQVYDSVAKTIVGSVCAGLNGTIFAYGQTSSGKTYTMQGSGTIAEGSAGSGGVVHMAAQDVFSHIEQHQDRIFLVRASFLEIYNEEVRDLLADNKVLQVREDPRRGVFVQSKEEIVTDFNSLLAILFEGEKSRAFASTAMNERSSRSHTIFRVTIESRKKTEGEEENSIGDSDDGAVRVSTLNLVDLAGSESVRHTGATGDRQKEGGMINQSLLTLSRVIVALGVPNQTHINFRDSKLTRILQPSLSGNARMAVVCCATPSELYLEETRSTLLFASRAKLVKTNAQVNEVLDDRSIIRRLQRELAEARRHGGGAASIEQARFLENKASVAESAAKEAEEKLKRVFESILNKDGAFFGDKGCSKRPSKRRRRLSEGNLIVGQTTPVQSRGMTVAPLTLPRPVKSTSLVLAKKMSPSSELSLLRAALTSKSDSMAMLMKQFDEASRLLQEKESELVAANCSNDILRSDRDKATEQSSNLAEDISTLRSELEAASIATAKLLKEKDSAIADALAKLEQELEDRRVLEETVDTLQEGKLSLEREISDQRVASNERISDLEKQLEVQSKDLGSQIASKEDFEVKLDEAKSELSSTKILLEEREEKLKEYAMKLENTEASLLSCKSELEEALQHGSTISAANEELLKEKQIKDDEIAALTQKNNKTAEDLQNAKEANAMLENQAETLKSAVDSCNKKVAKLESSLSEVGKERDELVSSVKSTAESLSAAEAQIETLTESQSLLESSNEAISEDSVTVRTELAAKIELLTKAQSSIDELSSNIEDLESEKTKAASEIDDLEKQSEELKKNAFSLEQKNAVLQSNLSELEKERDELIASVESRTESLRAAEAKIETLTESESSLKASVEAIQIELLTNTENHDAELAVKIELLANAQSNIDELTTSFEGLQKDKETASQEIERLRNENALATKQIDALQTKSDETIDKLAEVEKEACDLRERLNMVTSERDNAIKETETTADSMEEACIKIEGLTVALSQSEKDKKGIDQARANLEEEKNAVMGRLKELDASTAQINQSLESKFTAACMERDDAKAKAAAAIESIAQASAKIQGLTVVLSQSESDKETINSKLAAVQLERDSAIERVAELDGASKILESKLGKCSSDLDAARTESRMSKIAMVAAHTKVEGLTVVLAQREGMLDTLSESRDSLLEELKAARLSETTSLAKIQDMADSIKILDSEKDDLLSTVQSLVEEKDKALVRVAELESFVKTLDEQRLEAQTNLDSLKHQLAKSLAEQDAVREQLQEKSLNIAELESKSNSKIEELMSCIATMESEKESSATKAAEVLEERDETNVKLAEMNKEFSKLRAHADDLQGKIDELSEERDMARSELQAATELVTETQAELEQLSGTVNSLRSNKSTTEAALRESLEKEASAISRAECLDRKVVELNDKIAELENQCDTLQNEVTSASAKRESALNELVAVTESLTALGLKVEELESDRQALMSNKDIAASQQEKINSLLAQIEAQKQAQTTLQEELQAAMTQLESLSKANDSLESDLSKKSKELQSTRDELISVHDVLESTNARFNETKQRMNDLEDELESKVTMMSQGLAALEAERDRLTADLADARSQQQDLTRRVDELLSEKQAIEAQLTQSRDATAVAGSIEDENTELKQLLASANTSVEEARDTAQSAQKEVEHKERQLEEAFRRISSLEEELNNAISNPALDQSGYVHVDVENRLQDILEQKHRSDKCLEEERADRKRSEANLKRLMADEQRALIQEAEQTMQELRTELSGLQAKLEKSEAEAYAAREMKENLEDKNKLYLDQSIQLESRISALENENTRLRRASNRQDAEKDAELSDLKMNLQRVQEAQYAANISIADLKKQLERSNHEKKVTENELEAAREKLECIDAQGLESEVCRLKAEVKDLQSELAASRIAMHENIGAGGEATRLRAQCAEMKQQIQAKDERIKKLQRSKLTKDQAAAIKKLKADYDASLKEIELTKKELAKMKSRLSDESREDSEVTKLRFDKEALENKLRKFASHSQRLEDERAGILQALRSTNPDEMENDDIEQAIVSLCDKLASLEKECDSFVNSERRASSSLVEVDKLRTHNSSLQAEVLSSKKQIDKLLQSETELKGLVASLKRDQQELQSLAERAHANAESLESEKGSQLRFLEQENLRLMDDLKASKRNLMNVKAELNMLRAQGVSTVLDATPGTTTRKPGKSSSIQDSTATASKQPRTPAKENLKNKASERLPPSSATAKHKSSSQRTRRTPGFGEAFASSEENTQECKQS